MIQAPFPPDPSSEACTRYGVQDLAAQPDLQALCHLTGAALGVQHVAVVFMTPRRSWTPAATGWAPRTLGVSGSEPEPTAFFWTRLDPRPPPEIGLALLRPRDTWTFAAGEPLVTPEHVTVGLLVIAGDRPDMMWTPALQVTLRAGAQLVIQTLEGRAARLDLRAAQQQQVELQRRLERATLAARTFQAIADLTALPLDEDDGLRGAAQLTAELIGVDWSGVQMDTGAPLEAVWPPDANLAQLLPALPPAGEGPVFTLDSGEGWHLQDGRPAALAWLEVPGRAARLLFVRCGPGARWTQSDRKVLRDLVWALKHVLSFTAQRSAVKGLEGQLHFALRNFPMILWITDAQGRLVTAEGSGLRGLGVQADAVLGRSLQALAGEVDSPAIRDQLGRAQELRRTITLAGRVYDTHQVLLPGGGTLGVAFDVTDLAQSRAQAQRAQAHAEILLELTQILALSEPLRAVTARVMTVLLPALPGTTLVMWEQGASLRPLVIRGAPLPGPAELEARAQLPDALRRAVQGADPVALGRTELDLHLPGAGLKAALIQPITAGESHLLLAAYRQEEWPWAEHELESLAVASRVLQVSLERRETLTNLNAAARSDPLTGLCNRRAFEEDLAQRLRRGPLTLVTLDVDGLKTINDQFGHARGDALLRAVMQALRSVLSGDDCAYRVGGDEFCLLLGGEQRPVLVQLQVALDTLPAQGFPDAGASVGVAYAPQEGQQSETLWQLADERMYAEKTRRRRARRPT
ncbi:GGDEF domain-containing protein [Deinococcus radiotolerans]|uniref:GGDEF domain-containing protein n=1 Tax=Deinococcus radiotolerans TaxID=1309407 RepID=A0ABQ2FIP7_9DEIO|nr:sensor domain-containing diguanylate cyclase [Deinococcus radiotolerans]GGK99778.1 hypothetical protein GCM10010844_17640 [Deinococcus radiotolerans]